MRNREKVLFCWSGGKDSAFALNEALNDERYEVVALLTTVTKVYQRISMHGVREELLDEQAKQIGLPLIKVFISKVSSNEEYEEKMREALEKIKEQGVFTVAFGDIFLEDLKKYREERLAEVGMKAIFPIWKRDTKELALEFIANGFRTVIACIDSKILDKKFCGRDFDINFLSELPVETDHCGENGEFHSFVYDGPIFKNRVKYKKGEVVLRNERYYYCDLLSN